MVFRMTQEYLTWPIRLLFMLWGPNTSPQSGHTALCLFHLGSRHMRISDQSTFPACSDNRDSASVFSLSTKFNLYFYFTSEKEVSVSQANLSEPPLID